MNPIIENPFVEFKGLPCSALISIAMRGGHYEALYDFLYKDAELTIQNKREAIKVIDIFMDYLASHDPQKLKINRAIFTRLKRVLLKFEHEISEITDAPGEVTLETELETHLMRGKNLWELVQKGFHTRVLKPKTEFEYYTTDELIIEYRRFLTGLEKSRAYELHSRQLKELENVRLRLPLIYFSLKEIHNIVWERPEA